MIARYRLHPREGVLDQDLGVHVTRAHAGWGEYLRWLVDGGVADPVLVQVRESTLEQALAEKLALVEEIATQTRQRVTGRPSSQEMSSWPVKLQQAKAFALSSLDVDAPILVTEAAARGVSTADIVTRVLNNANAFSDAEARIAGVAGRHKDALRALATVAAVLQYDVTAGWPFQPPPPPRDPAPLV